jgi:peptidoglycan/LPS O-acetylase OafA/YrhL
MGDFVRPTLKVGKPMKRHYMALDGLRGVAALLVAANHTRITFELPTFAHSYLAVDFFFILSGFVIADAYEERLRNGMSFGRFSLVRAIRLYPMIAISALLGIAAIAATSAVPTTSILASGLAAVLVLPFPERVHGLHGLWPINPPEWSLFWEILINVAFAIFLFRLTRIGLVAFTLLGALSLAAAARHFDTLEVGFSLWNLWGGLARVLFGFVAGLALNRWHCSGGLPVFKTNIWVLAAVLVACLVFPLSVHKGAFDLAAVLILFPVIVVAGVSAGAEGALWRWSGRISYPLYLIHGPVLLLISIGILDHSTIQREAAVPAVLILYVGVAIFLTKFYDEPTRYFLGKWARLRSPVVIEDSPLSTQH